MRVAVAAVLLLPLLAGCGEPRRKVEAFQADYAVADGLVIRVRFGDVVDFLGSDGQIHAGYALTVNYAMPGAKLGRDVVIVDQNLHPVRTEACGNWFGGDCTVRSYAWDPREPDFQGTGIPLDLAGWTAGTARDGAFDGRIAPESFDWDPFEEGVQAATLTSYRPLGPLTPLPMDRLALLPRSAVVGPGLPGSDQDLPDLPYSLDDAVAYAAQRHPAADSLLRGGGCVQAFRVLENGPDEGPPARPYETLESTLAITLVNATHRIAVRVDHGWPALTGERTFLHSSNGFAHPHPAQKDPLLACGARPATATLPDLFELFRETTGGLGLPRGEWRTTDGQVWFEAGEEPTGRSQGSGALTIDGSAGGLRSWWGAPRAIDP